MTGQEAYEIWRAAVPDFVCNVPGGPWDELSKAARAGFDAIAAQQPQPAPAVLERKLAITLNALQRIDRTRRTVVDQGALWDIAQQAIDQVTEVDSKLMPAPELGDDL